MIYNEKHQLWLVHPTQHTNYIDVVDWCIENWGPYAIDNTRDGSWSYGHGDYYELTMLVGRTVEIPDRRLFFSFQEENAAIMFALRWA